MAASLNVLTLCQLFVPFVFGIRNYNPLSIQPANPTVREGDDVILNCHTSYKGSSASWYQVSESYSMFRSIERNSFPGGESLHLIGARRRQGEDTSTVSFLCGAPGRITDDRKLTSVTIVPRSSPLPVRSSVVVFPSNPVVTNGSNITLTCIAPSENETDIGWYVPGTAASKFGSHEIEKFENGANLVIVGITVDSPGAMVEVFCVQATSNFVSEPVTIRVTDTIPTTETPVGTKDPDEPITGTGPTTESNQPDRDAKGANSGPSVTLVLIAIAIGAGLAVFCICLIFLSVYTLFYFRSQSLEFLTRDTTDDVFKTGHRSIDNIHPYQSVTDGNGTAATKDGGVTGYADLNQYDVAGALGKGPYTDLTPYEDPRVYMRLESQSEAKPVQREVNTPDGIYEGDI